MGSLTMSTRIKRLTDKAVKNKRTPGRYADGDGLYLVVGADGKSKWWELLFRRGRLRKKGKGALGLGKYPEVTLLDARDKGRDARNLVARGIDPVAHRKQEREQRWLAECKSKTFLEIAEDLYTQKTEGDHPWWGKFARNKNRGILDAQLKLLHGLPVNSAEAADIITLKLHEDIVGPIWLKTPPMARDIKYLAVAICQHAHDLKVLPINVANPAGGPLDVLLKARQRKGGHWPALPYQIAPEVYAKLEKASQPARTWFTVREAALRHDKPRQFIQDMIEARKLPSIKVAREVQYAPIPYQRLINPEDLARWPIVVDVIPDVCCVSIPLIMFSMLTSPRPSEARLMEWTEYYEEEQLWIIPWQRTKEGEDIRQDMVIPLSEPANKIILMMRDIQQRYRMPTKYVFANYPSRKSYKSRHGEPACAATVLDNLRKVLPPEYIKVTMHGFRTTMRSWGEDQRRPDGTPCFTEKDLERSIGHAAGFGKTEMARLYSRKSSARHRTDP